MRELRASGGNRISSGFYSYRVKAGNYESVSGFMKQPGSGQNYGFGILKSLDLIFLRGV